jgi:hypothetical protein
MRHKLFSIYDIKAEAYLQPFFLQTKGQAIRAITDCVNDPNHQFSRHPADYTLFELGEYEDSNANFHLHETPRSLGVLVEFAAADNVMPLFEETKKEA